MDDVVARGARGIPAARADAPGEDRPEPSARGKIARPARADGAGALLRSHLAVTISGALAPKACADLARAVLGARADWTADFGGEQFSLGRAFYTHLETDRVKAYFSDADASDARVERHLPGLQAKMRAFVAALVGGMALPRRGFCGAGVHVFPAGCVVARRGGVVHYDTEGLTPHHLARRRPALSLVLMLQPPTRGGGLRVWDVEYDGRDEAPSTELRRPSALVRYRAGDLLVIDSYRLHQIRPFSGSLDRISVTVHAAAVDNRRWECWF